MSKFFKAIIAAVSTIAIVVGLSACAPSQSIDMKSVTAVIDVRTADEYAAGHLKGAINIDVESASFMDEIMKLDVNGTYVVYCHSGRRAGIAKDQMLSMGMNKVTNAGGISDAAAATGLPIVQ